MVVVETFIARPAKAVFTQLRDNANQVQWQAPHVVASTFEPPGPGYVGTCVHKIRRTGLGERRFTIQITEMDEDERHWTDVMLTGAFRGTNGSWQVLEEDGGSRMRLVAEMHTQGVWRLLLPLINRSVGKDLQAKLVNLNKTMESSPR